MDSSKNPFPIKKYLGFLLFSFCLIIGWATSNEYAVTWDEPSRKRCGEASYKYVFENDTSLFQKDDRDYGVAFELPLIIIQKIFKIKDIKKIYQMRHFVSHLFFLIGCFFLFRIIDYLYKNKLLATIGFALLLLHPRIYGHSFVNTKDIPFMSMFIITMYYSIQAFDRKTILSFIKVGICTGLIINIRLMGVLIPACIIFFLLLDSIFDKKVLTQLKLALCFIVTACVTLYITWPFLWSNPLEHFAFAFQNMSKFRWGLTVLFDGELIKATEIGWSYIPTWFIMTTPLLFSLLGFIGIAFLLFQFGRKPLSFLKNSWNRNNLMFIGYFILPVATVIFLKSVLYDGWRQVYFIYPSFVLLIIFGLSQIYLLHKSAKKIVNSLLIISLITTSIFTLRYFPHQAVYFNEYFFFTPEEYIRKNYEMDYWGVTYKKGLEFIAAYDTTRSVKVNADHPPGKHNKSMLPDKDRYRMHMVSKDEATYFITNFRWHPQGFEEYAGKEIHSIRIGKNTVNRVFKIK